MRKVFCEASREYLPLSVNLSGPKRWPRRQGGQAGPESRCAPGADTVATAAVTRGRTAALKPRPAYRWPVRATDVRDVIQRTSGEGKLVVRGWSLRFTSKVPCGHGNSSRRPATQQLAAFPLCCRVVGLGGTPLRCSRVLEEGKNGGWGCRMLEVGGALVPKPTLRALDGALELTSPGPTSLSSPLFLCPG